MRPDDCKEMARAFAARAKEAEKQGNDRRAHKLAGRAAKAERVIARKIVNQERKRDCN